MGGQAPVRTPIDRIGPRDETHTVGDVLDEYQRKVSPTKRGKRWEILRLELIGKRKGERCR